MTATALHPPTAASAPARKGVLFCPRCGHTSPVDGDWIVTVSTDRESTTCPDCGGPIATRPR